MNARYLVVAGAVAMSTIACGYSSKTATDYDRSICFTHYHSFSIVKGNSSGNPMMDQRALSDVVSALTSKGWIEVPAGDAQAAVVVHSTTKTKHTYETLYDGWGGGWGWRRGWGRGFGGSTTFVNDYKVGTLVVDIFDANTKQAIDKMFSNFPPGSAMAKGH